MAYCNGLVSFEKNLKSKNVCHSLLNLNTNCRLTNKFIGQFNSSHIYCSVQYITIIAYATEGQNLPL
jgi:hypothetical protein